MEAKDREIALLNEQITKLQHTEATSDNKVTEHAYKIDKKVCLQYALFRGCAVHHSVCVCVWSVVSFPLAFG